MGCAPRMPRPGWHGHFPAVRLWANHLPSLRLGSSSKNGTEEPPPPPVEFGKFCDLHCEAPRRGRHHPPCSLTLVSKAGPPVKSSVAAAASRRPLAVTKCQGREKAWLSELSQGRGGDVECSRGSWPGPTVAPSNGTRRPSPRPDECLDCSQAAGVAVHLPSGETEAQREEPFGPRTHLVRGEPGSLP